ncbi:hypothetical protein [Mycobacterium leprae]|uniref:hypothetical protein n=1 Tax=Mycobacterium leprae TaxID=1769 RepID=UPI001E64012E|nr:hypothetical protein [Mycobacterium leprae]
MVFCCISVVALLIAWMFKSTILRSDLLPFTKELPPYRFFYSKAVLVTMWGAEKMFLHKPTILLAMSVMLWAFFNLLPRDAEIS